MTAQISDGFLENRFWEILYTYREVEYQIARCPIVNNRTTVAEIRNPIKTEMPILNFLVFESLPVIYMTNQVRMKTLPENRYNQEM